VRLRRLLMQEAIRAIALGYVAFLFLAVIRERLGLSAGQILTLSGLIALGISLTLTAIRLITGWELRARTKRGWIIMGGVTAILLASLIGVAAMVGQMPSVLRFGPWSVVMAVLFLILSIWLGYRSTVEQQ